MIIDFHTHIFPPEIAEHRERFLEGEPAFALLYEPPSSRMAGADALVDVMDECGVDMSVVFGFPWKRSDTFKRHNDYIIESVGRFPDRLIGFGCFDIMSPEAPSEAERCIDSGLSGIGELALYEGGIDERGLDALAPVMEICLNRNLPVLIHTNEPVGHEYPGKTPVSPDQIYRLIKRFPDNRIVLAHWGGGIFLYSLMKKEVRQAMKNVWFDTAASPYLYEPAIYRIASETIGAEKILFGSDYPLITPSRYFREMDGAGIGLDEKDKICGRNASVFFDIL